MMYLILFALCAVYLVSGTTTLKTAPIYTVNLDVEPAQRWPAGELCTKFAHPMKNAVQMLNDFVPNAEIREGLILAASALVDSGRLGTYGEEIRGIFAHPACSTLMPLGTGVLLNLIYEVQAGCTSIVAKAENGTMIHGRNLDFDQSHSLSELAIQVQFMKNDSLLFTSATFAGYVGVLTGMKAHAFSVSMDERDLGESNPLLFNVIAFLLGGRAEPFVARKALEMFNTYPQAISLFQKVDLISPVYIIAAGAQPNEGEIITRFRADTAFVTKFPSANETFPFLVETNYDQNKPAGDPRRAAARKALLSLVSAHQINLAGLLKVLSTHPVLNDGTTMTVLMSPTTGYFVTYPRVH